MKNNSYLCSVNKKRERYKEQNRQNNSQLAEPVRHVKEKDASLIELGKYFYTLSQLVFGGVVLSVLLDFSDRKFLALILGLMAVIAFALMGWVLVKSGNIKN